MIRLNIPDLDEVIAEANRKGLTMYRITKETGLSSETVSRYFSGQKVTTRTMERIINYINGNNEPTN
jgi:lambda repressor-like predicted transcriptional regulator